MLGLVRMGLESAIRPRRFMTYVRKIRRGQCLPELTADYLTVILITTKMGLDKIVSVLYNKTIKSKKGIRL